MTRNDLADLYAIAAMPGLDELAAIIDEHDTVSRRRSNAVTLGFFIVGKAVTGADDQLDGLLRIPTVWALMRQSVRSVGPCRRAISVTMCGHLSTSLRA